MKNLIKFLLAFLLVVSSGCISYETQAESSLAQGLYSYIGSQDPTAGADNEYVTDATIDVGNSFHLFPIYVDASQNKTYIKLENLNVSYNDVKVDDKATLVSEDHGDSNGPVILKNDIAPGVYKFSTVQNEITYTFTLTVESCPLATYKYTDDNTYMFGLFQYREGEQDPLFVEYGRRNPIFNNGTELAPGFLLVLAAGKQLGYNEHTAPEKLINGISNISVTVDQTKSTIPANLVEIVIPNEKVFAFNECNCYRVFVNIKKNNEEKYPTGVVYLNTSFDLTYDEEQDPLHLQSVQKYELYEPVVKNIDLTEADMVVDTFNSTFGSINGLLERYSSSNLNDANYIYFHLPKDKGESQYYAGRYVVNVEGLSNNPQINFVGATDVSGAAATTINGTFEVNGGEIILKNINFVADSEIETSHGTLNISDETIGVITRAISEETRRAGIVQIENCNFDNYDYAIVSTNSGTVGEIKYCTFRNNGYGFYFNPQGCKDSTEGDVSCDNTFIDTKNAAIAILSTTANKPAYALRFIYNNFYNTTSGNDYLVGVDGLYYFVESYYGNNATIGKTNNNVRNPKVDQKSDNAMAFVFPAVLYPEAGEGRDLGIGTGTNAYAAVFANNSVTLNSACLNNIESIMIADATGENLLGGLRND